MKSIVLVLAIIAAACAASIQKHNPIDWYNCSQKEDGNYYHPRDCTRFIFCAEGIAFERDCPLCRIDPIRCPEGRMVYNETIDACLWADMTLCQTNV